MNRYRFGLGVLTVVIIAAVLFSALRSPGAPTVSSGAGNTILPVSQRAPAPEFTGIDGWINSQPLNLASLRGKVVLIDFWTFSCVNCVRTIPHLQQLYSAYPHSRFVIVGVHSPEFDFEKVPQNVSAAVKRLGISWPVAIDSEMSTWNAYNNQYWPAEYLLDAQGRIAYNSFGEGDYAQTNAAVAALLGVSAASEPSATSLPTDMTPELYAGSERGQLADGEAYGSAGQPTNYPDPGNPQQQDAILVTGKWTDYGQYLQADGAGHIRLEFRADSLYIVAGSSTGSLSAQVKVDGRVVAARQSGPGLDSSKVSVPRKDLYRLLINISSGYHLIDISVPSGFQLYTFTFG